MRIRVSTETCLDEPDADAGFISWLEITILDHNETDREVVVGTARAAIIHVGAATDAGAELHDAMDADSGEVEALHATYFDDDWFKDSFTEGAGRDLLYVSSVDLPPSAQGRNIELALVHRLCDTLGSGCELVVVRYDGEADASQWRAMGFEKTDGARGLMHLKLAFQHPRIVADPRGEGYLVVPVASPEQRRRMH